MCPWRWMAVTGNPPTYFSAFGSRINNLWQLWYITLILSILTNLHILYTLIRKFLSILYHIWKIEQTKTAKYFKWLIKEGMKQMKILRTCFKASGTTVGICRKVGDLKKAKGDRWQQVYIGWNSASGSLWHSHRIINREQD